jgi:hypothetical protein
MPLASFHKARTIMAAVPLPKVSMRDVPLREVPTGPTVSRAASRVVVMTPRDVRAAIAAARRQGTFAKASGRVAALAVRARRAAWFPRLQLRATRLIDESSSLSPTSYDPERRTYSGGARTWLEARTSWSLDRLFFAGDEFQAERLRHQIALVREKQAQGLVVLLSEWQRAAFDASHPSASQAQCRRAWLDERQLAMRIDWLTGGWLGRWRKKRSPPVVYRCPERAPAQAIEEFID